MPGKSAKLIARRRSRARRRSSRCRCDRLERVRDGSWRLPRPKDGAKPRSGSRRRRAARPSILTPIAGDWVDHHVWAVQARDERLAAVHSDRRRDAPAWIASPSRRCCSLGKDGAACSMALFALRASSRSRTAVGGGARSLGRLRRLLSCAAGRASSTRRATGSKRARSPKGTSRGRSTSPPRRCGSIPLESGPPGAPRLGVIFRPGTRRPRAGFLARRAAVRSVRSSRAPPGRCDVSRSALRIFAPRRRRRDSPRACRSFRAALRYHTADTMSHGWAALLFAAVLAFAYRQPTRDADQASPARRALRHRVGLVDGDPTHLRASLSCPSLLFAAFEIGSAATNRRRGFGARADRSLRARAARGDRRIHGVFAVRVLRGRRRTSGLLSLRLRCGHWMLARAR